jgi:GNAT superfamily N-acetyltransferase
MDAADYNFAYSIGVFSSTSKTGEVLEARDFVLANTKAPVATFNQAFLKQPSYKLDRTLDRVLAYYKRAGVPFRLHVSDEHEDAARTLRARGFVQGTDAPCMVLADATCRPEGLAPIADLRVRRVDEAESLGHFQRIAFESFGYPVELAPLALTAELARLPTVELFVSYLGGQPACCAGLLTTGDMAGIYWVGALAEHRRRGLGAAITAHAVHAGRARGCRNACLQASTMGKRVYVRLGFVVARTYRCFDHPAPGP